MISGSTLAYSTRTEISQERRYTRASLFHLIELQPEDVIDDALLSQGYMPGDAIAAGYMREHCPHCRGVALQLILRYRHVKRTHLFCDCCGRCYDGLYPDGTSALALGSMSLV